MPNDALRVMSLLDLTELSYDCTPEKVEALCKKAVGGPVNVAAVCVWPTFVGQAVDLLGGAVKIAAVANFPFGGDDAAVTEAETERAVADGADEIDVVLPWHHLLLGKRAAAEAVVTAARRAAAQPMLLKVILETGHLADHHAIRDAAELAIDCGADFIKTSTGKTPVSATLDAAGVMLEVIREQGGRVGLKPSGGIRTLDDANRYLRLADQMMGVAWATPRTFRFGASALYDDLL